MNKATLAALALVVMAAACSRSPDKSHALVHATPIRFATDWRAQAEQGGFYEALADGEYARRGLAVTIVPGGPGVNVPRRLSGT